MAEQRLLLLTLWLSVQYSSISTWHMHFRVVQQCFGARVLDRHPRVFHHDQWWSRLHEGQVGWLKLVKLLFLIWQWVVKPFPVVFLFVPQKMHIWLD